MLELAWGGPKGLLATSEKPLSEIDGDKFGSTPAGAAWWFEGLAGNGIPLPLTDFTFPCGGAIVVACLPLFDIRGIFCFRELGVEGALFDWVSFKSAGLR